MLSNLSRSSTFSGTPEAAVDCRTHSARSKPVALCGYGTAKAEDRLRGLFLRSGNGGQSSSSSSSTRRRRGHVSPSGSHACSAGPAPSVGLAVATTNRTRVQRPSRARASRTLASRPEEGSQNSTGVGDPGRVGEFVVVVQLGGQAVERFGAPVVLEEEVDLAVALAPAAVAVRSNDVAPLVVAAAL